MSGYNYSGEQNTMVLMQEYVVPKEQQGVLLWPRYSDLPAKDGANSGNL
jgi:hypothetical protein